MASTISWSKALYAASQFTASSTFNIITLTPQKRAFLLIILLLLSIFSIIFFASVFVLHQILRFIPLPRTNRPRRYIYNAQRDARVRVAPAGANIDEEAPRGRYYPAYGGVDEGGRRRQRAREPSDIGHLFTFDLISSVPVFGISLLDVAFRATTTAVSLLIGALPILFLLGMLLTGSLFFSMNTQPIASALHSANVTFVRPIVDYVLMPILGLLLMLYQAVYAGWLTVNRLTRFLIAGPGLTLIQCAFPILPNVLVGIGDFAATIAFSIAFWVANNPINTDFPLADSIQVLTNIVSDVWDVGVSCACNVLNYIVGGIFKCLRDPNFAFAIDNLFNAAYNLLTGLFIHPLVFLVRPSVDQAFILTNQGLIALGTWIEVVATCQFDIWIYGGNGTLINMVNGSLPMPTDDLQYLVRFLQSDWAQGTLLALHTPIVLIGWQPLYIIFRIDQVFTSSGAQVWNFDWLRETLLGVLDALSTLIDVLPVCNNPPTFSNIPFGNLVSILRAIVWLAQIILDVVVGEIYTTLNVPSRPFGYFLSIYLLANGPTLQNYAWEIDQVGNSLGCTIAYLDKSIGVSLDGLASAVLVYVPKIPTQFIAYLRYLIETGDVNVLDSIDVQPLQDALLQVSKVGEFWFQFQPGATELTCPTSITFFCSLGIFTQRILAAAFMLLTLAIRILIYLIKVIVGSIQSGSLNSITIPDFKPTLDTLYTSGCRLGMVFGLLIPLDLPCMDSRPGFCVVSEFKGQTTSTLSICMATMLCKVGNILVVPVDLLFTGLSYVISLNPTGSPLMIAVRQVFNIIIFRILSPICPLAHFFDCLFDVLFQTGSDREGTPATSFFCLLTGALVYLVQTVGEIILQWLDFIITIVIGLLGGIQGDAGQWLLDVLKKFFALIGATLEKVLSAIINLVISIFMGVVVAICWIINVFIFFTISNECTKLEESIQAIFGGASAGFLSPDYINYKRDAKGERRECSLSSSHSFANFFFAQVQSRYPSFIDPDALGFQGESAYVEDDQGNLYVNESAAWRQMEFMDSDPHAEQCLPNHKRSAENKRQPRNESIFQRIMLAHFGPGPEHGEDMPTYLATRVYWEPSSTCAVLFHYINGTKTSQLGAAERVQVSECIRLKAVAVVLRAFTVTSWVPEDLFYNGMLRGVVIAIQLARFFVVFLQWLVDQVVPPSVLMTAEYQAHWMSMHLDMQHYADLRLVAMPDVLVEMPVTAMRITAAMTNYTLDSYLRRNFPDLYNESSSIHTDPILGPLYKIFRFVGDFGTHVADGIYNQSTWVSSANTTSYYYTHDMGNRTALLEEFGPEVMRAADTRLSTIGMFETISAAISAVMTIIRGGGVSPGGKATPGDNFRDMLIEFGNSMPTLTKRAVETPYAIWDQTSTLWERSRTNMQKRVQIFYSAPAFASTPSPLAGMIAGLGDLYTRAANIHPHDAIPPWCSIKAARFLNITYAEARLQATPELCEQLTTWQIVTNESSNALGFFQRMMRPRNAQAEAGRNATWKLGSQVSDAIWSAVYVLYGGDKTMRTVVERAEDVKNGAARDVDYYNPVRTRQIRQRQQNLARQRQKTFQEWRKVNGQLVTEKHKETIDRSAAFLAQTAAHEKRQDVFYPMQLRAKAKQQMRQQGLHVGDREGMHAAAIHMVETQQMDPIFNSSFLFEKQCSNLTGALCEQCYFLARFVDVAAERVAYLVFYYTGYFINIVGEIADTILYSLNQFASARIGRDGTSSARFPELGAPAGIFFQFTDAEITNGGPSLTLWLERVIGGSISGLWGDGPCNQRLSAYIAAKNAAQTAAEPFQTQFNMEALQFIQQTVGLNVCALVDTVVYIATDRVDDIGSYAVDHLIRCHYLQEIDCTQQDYSFSGGLLVTLVWIGGAMFASFLLLMPFPMFYLPVMMGLLIAAPFFHAIITYNWSAWCSFVPPQCEVYDAWKFTTLTVVPKCSILGGLILNNTYNVQNCYQSNLTWDFADCQEQGFNTIFDNLAYFKLWLGGDLGISEWLAPIYGSIWGSTTPTTDFPDWNTNPVLFSVYGQCSVITAAPYGFSAAIAIVLASIVLLSVLSVLPFLILALVLFFANMMRYSMLALNDIFDMIDLEEDDDEEGEGADM